MTVPPSVPSDDDRPPPAPALPDGARDLGRIDGYGRVIFIPVDKQSALEQWLDAAAGRSRLLSSLLDLIPGYISTMVDTLRATSHPTPAELAAEVASIADQLHQAVDAACAAALAEATGESTEDGRGQ